MGFLTRKQAQPSSCPCRLLVEADLQDPEFSFLSNIMPEMAEEAKTLQPTLQARRALRRKPSAFPVYAATISI